MPAAYGRGRLDIGRPCYYNKKTGRCAVRFLNGHRLENINRCRRKRDNFRWTEKDAIRSAYRMTGSNNFYDGMMTCSTLSGKAVCRLVWAMNRADCEEYQDAAMAGTGEQLPRGAQSAAPRRRVHDLQRVLRRRARRELGKGRQRDDRGLLRRPAPHEQPRLALRHREKRIRL